MGAAVRFVRFVLWLLVFIFGAWLAYDHFGGMKTNLLERAEGRVLEGSFEALADGAPVSREDWLGRPHIVFFGYTHCPDFCPVSLDRIVLLRESLGADAALLDFYFVTVDPKRDDSERLRAYLDHFGENIAFGGNITAISGSEKQMARIREIWNVFAQEEEDGFFSHTTTAFLMNEKGRLASTIAFGENETIALEKLRKLFKAQ